MDNLFIISVYCISEELMNHAGHQSHPLATMSDAEVITVAVVAAKYFKNHQERALGVMSGMGFVPKLSISRFNRRLHQLKRWLDYSLEVLTELFRTGQSYLIDSCPMPVCKRKRAGRCKKVKGKAFCGYCAAKDEKFFGWRLHLICSAEGVPVSFAWLEGGYHDLTAIHELTYDLPEGAYVYGDKAFNSEADEQSIAAETGVNLIPYRKKNMHKQNSLSELFALQAFRKRIETLYSQLESMGLQCLKARTNDGFFIKAKASLFALAVTNIPNIPDWELFAN